MFYDEVDIDPAINVANSLFGSPNKYEEYGYSFVPVEDQLHIMKNVSIATKEFGKLWYGDLSETQETLDKINILSDSINQRVYIIRDYDFDNPLVISTNKLRPTEEFQI